MPSYWYVMQSKPNREDALFQQLSTKEVEVYYPWIRVAPVNPRSRKIKAYFPGYLFVNVNIEKIGASVLQFCPFAKGLVTFDREPVAVSDALVAALRVKLDAINNTVRQSYSGLAQGDLVHIHSGPFAGYNAIFDERLPGQERVKVLLLLINNNRQKLELQINQIKPEINPNNKA